MTSPNYFLKLDDGIEPKFVVIDQEDFCMGEGYEIPEAIKSARKNRIPDEDILCDAGVITTTPAKEFIQDKDALIRELSHIAGVRITRMLDDNLNFKGYNMELIE